jgi:predicted nucleic acid-binding protein
VTLPRERFAFVDTSAWYAALALKDANHERAQQTFGILARDRRRLVSTSYVVAETHALFLRKIGRDAGVAFLRGLERSAIAVERPLEIDELAGREIIYRYADKTFSLTDAISFAVMERMGIAVAFSFDRDFERYGFSAPAT